MKVLQHGNVSLSGNVQQGYPGASNEQGCPITITESQQVPEITTGRVRIRDVGTGQVYPFGPIGLEYGICPTGGRGLSTVQGLKSFHLKDMLDEFRGDIVQFFLEG